MKHRVLPYLPLLRQGERIETRSQMPTNVAEPYLPLLRQGERIETLEPLEGPRLERNVDLPLLRQGERIET